METGTWSPQELLFVTNDDAIRISPGEIPGSDRGGFCRALMNRLASEPWAAELRGIVIPLEIRVQAFEYQEMLGLDILEWIRWYEFPYVEPERRDALHRAPALVVAAQSMAKVLTRRPNLLLTSPGTSFALLPCSDRVAQFIERVRDRNSASEAIPASLQLSPGASLQQVLQQTHHDLANEGFAAHRLLVGYDRLLTELGELGTQQAVEIRDAIRSECLDLPWFRATADRAAAPAVQQYEALFRRHQTPPSLSFDEDLELKQQKAFCSLLKRHVTSAPLEATVLLVDDDHASGAADAIRLVLHGGVTGAERAKVIPVDSIEAARATFMECMNAGKDSTQSKSTLKKHTKSKSTPTNVVVLLDLRLVPEDRAAPPSDWGSIRWLEELNDDWPAIPVLLFSATRSLAVYQAATRVHPDVQWLHKPFPGDGASERASAGDLLWKVLGTLSAGGALWRLSRGQIEKYLSLRAHDHSGDIMAELNRAAAFFLKQAAAVRDAPDAGTAERCEDPGAFYFGGRSPLSNKAWYQKFSANVGECEFLLRRRLIFACYLTFLSQPKGTSVFGLDAALYKRALIAPGTGARGGGTANPSQMFNPDDVGFGTFVRAPPARVFSWLLPEECQWFGQNIALADLTPALASMVSAALLRTGAPPDAEE